MRNDLRVSGWDSTKTKEARCLNMLEHALHDILLLLPTDQSYCSFPHPFERDGDAFACTMRTDTYLMRYCTGLPVRGGRLSVVPLGKTWQKFDGFAGRIAGLCAVCSQLQIIGQHI